MNRDTISWILRKIAVSYTHLRQAPSDMAFPELYFRQMQTTDRFSRKLVT